MVAPLLILGGAAFSLYALSQRGGPIAADAATARPITSDQIAATPVTEVRGSDGTLSSVQWDGAGAVVTPTSGTAPSTAPSVNQGAQPGANMTSAPTLDAISNGALAPSAPCSTCAAAEAASTTAPASQPVDQIDALKAFLNAPTYTGPAPVGRGGYAPPPPPAQTVATDGTITAPTPVAPTAANVTAATVGTTKQSTVDGVVVKNTLDRRGQSSPTQTKLAASRALSTNGPAIGARW